MSLYRIAVRISALPGISIKVDDDVWPKNLYIYSPEFSVPRGRFYGDWANDDGVVDYGNDAAEKEFLDSIADTNRRMREWFQREFGIEQKDCDGYDPDVFLLSVPSQSTWDRLMSEVRSINSRIDPETPQGLEGWIHFMFLNAEIHEIDEFRAPARTMIRSDGDGEFEIINAPKEPPKKYLN